MEIKFQKIQNTKFLTAEARLVFLQEGGPATSETPRSATDQLKAGMQKLAEKEAQNALGEAVHFDEVKNDLNKFGDLMDRLAGAFHDNWDKFLAIFAPLDMRPSEIDAAVNRPDDMVAQITNPDIPPEDAFQRATHANAALDRNPTWNNYIEKAAEDYGFPETMLTAFIEMESSFDPNKRPLDSKTKKPRTSALGLAQALNDQFNVYRREKPNLTADPTDPAAAIDFMGWHLTRTIREVNDEVDQQVQRENFPESYKLSPESDTQYLYMAYNSGGLGYLKLRRYMDNPTPENFDGLTSSQKKDHGTEKDGTLYYEWELRSRYAKRVEETQKAYEKISIDAEIAIQFDTPPLPAVRKTSGYGDRIHPLHHDKRFHNGVDYGAPEGTPVYAVKAGVIAAIVPDRPDGISGNYVIIRHEDGSRTEYLHLNSFAAGLTKEQQVTAGTIIGAVGQTGGATGPHLHFMYRDPKGRVRNPEAAVVTAIANKNQ
ncbi:MAG: peptidoglycan DD-metalloendopeptidase family protein [Patescibacteria group bacterium]